MTVHTIAALTRAHAVAKVNGAASPPRTPPTIRTGLDLARVVDEGCAALGLDGETYQRDGELVRIVRAAEPDPRRGIVPGTPTIRPLALATLRERLSLVARWERYDSRSESFRECSPPEPVIAAVAARGEWSTVRPLAGVVEAPCLRADGSILSTPGYDRATGLVLVPGVEVPPIPEQPTHPDCMRALARLCGVFGDFPFALDAARYVPTAAVLTMLARPAIDGSVPMLAIDASTRGSGKSLLADVISIITTGRSAPRMTYPPDETELEKVLAACALFGARIVALDNIAGTLGAAPLDKVLTADDRVALRVLGRSEMREVQWRALVLATGNNLVLGADTARRTLVCRLEPDVERPEERTGFRHADLLGHVREHRGELVAAALTILRGFVAAGRPDASRYTWGSFRSWAELVPAAIAWAGGQDVLACRAVSLGSSEPEADALRVVLGSLGSLVPEGGTARTIVGILWPATDRGERRPPDGWDALRDALEVLCPPRRSAETPTPTRLGRALRRYVGRVVGGRRLTCRDDRTGTAMWSVQP